MVYFENMQRFPLCHCGSPVVPTRSITIFRCIINRVLLIFFLLWRLCRILLVQRMLDYWGIKRLLISTLSLERSWFDDLAEEEAKSWDGLVRRNVRVNMNYNFNTTVGICNKIYNMYTVKIFESADWCTFSIEDDLWLGKRWLGVISMFH